MTVEKIGNSISCDHSTFGKYLNETAGKAKYKIHVLIPLWASGCIDFVALNTIPAIIQTAINIKFTIFRYLECKVTIQIFFTLKISLFIQCLFFIKWQD